MIKKQFVNKLAKKVGVTQRDTAKMVDALCELIAEELVNGETVKMNGFGSFQSYLRAAKKARNPITGEEIIIPATNVVVFKPSCRLADSVANTGKTMK